MKLRGILSILVGIFFIPAIVVAQNQQTYPRIRLSFDGSTTANTLDLGGWTRIRTSLVTPGLSAAGELRWYFNGTNLMISENGGAYRIVGAGNGTVTSVGLAFSPTSIWTVSGSPVTTTGTLTATLATQTANTLFSGPTTGAAAQPTFRTMVLADIPNALITFAKWNSNGCVNGNIPKMVGGVWACAGDDTSPGGTSWLTTGNTVTAAGSFIGSLDNFSWDLRANNTVFATINPSGVLNMPITGSRITIPNTSIASNHGLDISNTGAIARYWKLGNIASCTGVCVPGGTEAVIYYDGTDTWLKNGTATAFKIGANVGITTYVQWTAKQATQPTTAFASFDVRNDHPIVAFSDAATEAVLFEGIMPEEWDGTTFDVAFNWVSTATTGNVRWECAIERDDAATDIDADSFGTVVLVTTTTGTTAGFQRITSCSMSSSAIRDNLAAGEPFRVRIRRIGADAADTMTADAQILTVQVRHP